LAGEPGKSDITGRTISVTAALLWGSNRAQKSLKFPCFIIPWTGKGFAHRSLDLTTLKERTSMSLGTFSRALFCLIFATSSSMAFAQKGDRQLTQLEQEAIASDDKEATPEETAEELPPQEEYVITPANGEAIEIYIDKTSQTMEVYYGGSIQYRFPVSTARYGYTTPNGQYQVYLMEEMHYSRKYDNSPMPHSMFYSGGFAIHGSYAKGFPRYGSHGCVRLPPQHAATLYAFVKETGNGRAVIHISGLDAPASKRRVEVQAGERMEKKSGKNYNKKFKDKKEKKNFFEFLFGKKKKSKKKTKQNSTESEF
jgi:hypothetical protein